MASFFCLEKGNVTKKNAPFFYPRKRAFGTIIESVIFEMSKSVDID
jgi:hypothetical protein